MRTTRLPLLLFLAAATTLAEAATTNKLNNGTALDQAGSWDNGVPTSADTAVWTGSLSTTASIGGNGSNTTGLTVGGIVANSSGDNTISANSQSTLTISGNVAVSNGTFTVDSRVNLGASTRIFNVESAMNMTAGNVVGSGATINKQGNGTLRITNGAYTNLTLTAGIFSTGLITNSNSISGLGNADGGAARLQFAGGTLRYTGAATSTDRAFRILSGNGTFDASGTGALNWGTGVKVMDYGASTNASRALTLTGTNTGNNTMGTVLIDNGTGKLSVTKSGAGTWVLSKGNTYTGATTISAGTLVINHANALGTTGNITFGGGALQYGTGITQDLSSRIKNSTSAIAIDTNGNDVTFAGVLGSTNSGGLTKNGSGTLALTGNNTYTGATTVNAGTLQAAATGALAHTSQVVLNEGGSFLVTAANAVNDNAAINLNGGRMTVSGNFDETVGLLTLSANSTLDFSGFGGTLRFGGIGSWAPGATLAIWNWSGTTQYGTQVNNYAVPSNLVFTDNSNLHSNLALISFYSDSGSSFVGNGFDRGFSPSFGTEIIAVPEVSAFSVPLLCLAGLGLHRLFYLCQRNRRRSAVVS